ncbi:MAG: AAA family ATPase [Kofleriaceae bacterium]
MSRRSARTNVVDSLASLVGRQRERAALTACLDAGARLVTIVGPGGVGKTRVATRLAIEQVPAYAAHGGGGVWLVDLVGVATVGALAARVARVLGIPLDHGADDAAAVARVGAALARRQRILLVLDNGEHLEAAAVSALAAWLAQAPRAQVVATSRVPLGVPGEQPWPLVPLEVPTDGAAATATEAMVLFVARAQAVRPALALEVDGPTIAAIVRRLGGLPLAIELAAARLQVLTPAELLARLERPLELLVRPGDDGRHGSMRRTIVDSLELCAADVRACFADCAVFAGAFTLAAAEAVLGETGRPVLAHLERLCAGSLLRLDHAGGRLAWLEVLREAAAAALDATPGRRAVLAVRHAEYFAARAEALSEPATAATAASAAAELAAALDDLVAAHAHAVARAGDDPRAARQVVVIALALDPVLASHGRSRLRRRLLDAAVAVPPRQVDAALAVRARLARAQCRRELGDLAGAGDDLAAAAADEVAATPALAAQLALARGELIEIAGDTVAARAAYLQALAAGAAAGAAPRGLLITAEAQARLGHAFRREGELAAAAAAIAQADAIYQQLGHQDGAGAMAYEAGVIALFAVELAAARAAFTRAAVIAAERGNRLLAAAVDSALGILLQAAGDVAGAVAHHADAVSVFRDLGNRHREGSALYYLGGAYLELDEPAQALVVLLQAADAVGVVGAARYQALIAGAQSAALAQLGDRAAATAAAAAAERYLAACPDEPALAATLAIHRHQLAWPGDDPAALAAVVAATQAVAAGAPGDDPAWAARLIARRAAQVVAARPTLWVAADAVEVRVPGEPQAIDLRRRAPLRRIVLALVAQRLRAPGEALAQDELVAAGWPGEYISHGAAGNRLHVALSTLRKLGLRPYLHSGEHGYFLAPGVAVELGRPGTTA